jgi:hypothetical protein
VVGGDTRIGFNSEKGWWIPKTFHGTRLKGVRVRVRVRVRVGVRVKG